MVIKIVCPKCKNSNRDKFVKMGFKMTTKGKVQRYQCKKCGASITQGVTEIETHQPPKPQQQTQEQKPLTQLEIKQQIEELEKKLIILKKQLNEEQYYKDFVSEL